MATAREALEVQATLQDRFTAPLNRIQGRIRTFSQRSILGFNKLAGSVVNLRGLLVALGGAVTVRAFSRMVSEVAETADQIGKLSDRLGISTEFLSQLQFVAEQSGIEFNTFANVVQKLSRRAAEFRENAAGPTAEAFRALGAEVVSAVEAGERMEILLPKIAEGFKRIEDPQRRVLFAQRLFESEGVPALQAFTQNFAGLLRQGKRFQISPEEAKAAADLRDRMNELSREFFLVKQKLAIAVLPALTDVYEGLLGFVRGLGLAESGALRLQQALSSNELVLRQLIDLFGEFSTVANIAKGASEDVAQFFQKNRGRLDELVLEIPERTRQIEQIEATVREREARRQNAEGQARIRERMRLALEQDHPRGATVNDLQLEIAVTDRFRESLDEARTAVDGLHAGLRLVAEQGSSFNVMQGAIVNVAHTLESSLTNNLVAFLNQAEEGKFRFKDFARSILRDLQRIAIQMIVVRAISSAAGGLAGLIGGGGGGGVDFGGGASGTPGSQHGILATAAQHGGILGGARPQMVLAHPPEAFVPLPGPGRGIPVEFTGRGGGGGQTIINQSFNLSMIDTKSFDDRALESLARNAEIHATATADQFRRDPAMASSFMRG